MSKFFKPSEAKFAYNPNWKNLINKILDDIKDTKADKFEAVFKARLINDQITTNSDKFIEQNKNELLMITTKNSNHKAVEYLVGLEGIDLNVQNDERKTPLIIAIGNGEIDIAETLIKSGADLNIQDSSNRTALIIAAQKSQNETIQLLIDRSANLNIEDQNGISALTYSIIANNSLAINLLVSAGTNFNFQIQSDQAKLDFISAIDRNQNDVFGALINLQDKLGRTPLIIATQKKDYDFFNKLIEAGADINIKDQEEKTALTYSLINRDRKIINALIAKQANFDRHSILSFLDIVVEDKQFLNEDFISCVEEGKKEDTLKNLINYKNDCNESPLSIAIEEKKYDCVDALIKFGVNVNLTDRDTVDKYEFVFTKEICKTQKESKKNINSDYEFVFIKGKEDISDSQKESEEQNISLKAKDPLNNSPSSVVAIKHLIGSQIASPLVKEEGIDLNK